MQNCFETKMNKYIPISCNNNNLKQHTDKQNENKVYCNQQKYCNCGQIQEYTTLIELVQVKQATCLLI